MKASTLLRVLSGLALGSLAACASLDSSSPTQPPPGDFPDTFGARPVDPGKTAAMLARAQTMIRPGSVVQTEPRLGVPTFVWAREAQRVSAPNSLLASGVAEPEIAASRAALADFAPLYGLDEADVANAVVSQVHDRGKGPVMVKFHAEIDGIEIFREELNVVMNRKLEPIALSGYLTSAAAPRGATEFSVPQQAGAANALGHMANLGIQPSMLVAAGSRDGYDFYNLSPAAGVKLDDPIRMKRVYYHAPEGLVSAYYVEVTARTGVAENVLSIDGSPVSAPEAYAYVVSAATGQLLSRTSLMAEAGGGRETNAVDPGGFTYRVWADPVTGYPYDTPAGNAPHPKAIPLPDGAQAPFAPTVDVTLSNLTFSRHDPWLPAGATETVGNNVDAFLNLFAPDGYFQPIAPPSDPPTGDFRAQITAPGQFLHEQIPDGNGALAEGRQGAIQQLFYNINFLHDWFYDAGFDEASRNAQTDNFGRGGAGGDSIRGQAQDFSGFSNANMLTPADGARPRMRMYVFPSLANNLGITGLGQANIGVSMSGPQTYDINSELVIATFSNAPACTVTNAAALDGKIAMFDFDNTDATGCAFGTRITRLTATTATSMVMVFQQANPNVVANIINFNPASTKPVATISWTNGQVIKAALLAGPVTARLFRAADRDGSLDQQIVFHEFFHYVSNRLVGNGSGLGAQQSAGMGEGWSDFAAMLLTVREEDTQVPSNATWNGAYALATYATSGVPFNGTQNQGYYFGIRRYPYSTDLTKNPMTFTHISNGVPLPVGPPVGFGADGANNAEVHNTGEVWANMLWECYAGILRDTLGPNPRLTFQEAQDRMKAYVIGGLKVTPLFPTITEARDAVLAVALANDPADYVACRIAFAKRGAGAHAVSPDRAVNTNVGVVEDFTVGPELSFVTATLDDSLGSCDDDGVVDHGEYGKLSVTLRNDGITELTATTAAITTASTDVWFPEGTTLRFPTIPIGGSVTQSLRVAYLRTVTGIQQVDFSIEIGDPQVTGTQTKVVGFRTNTDEEAGASATDTAETVATPWTPSFDANLGNLAPWRRLEVTPLNHVHHVDDAGGASDQILTSPAFTVAAGDTVTLAFDHSWSFESAGPTNFDGAVIEMSVNGGAFADIGASAYNGTIATGGTNPLRGRPGFVGSSAGTVHTVLTQTVAAGSTVRIRFRAGADAGVGAPGWNIDNLAFGGVTETPFGNVVPDPDACTVVAESADLAVTVSDGVTSVRQGETLTYTITASNVSGDDIIGANVADVFSTDATCTWTCVGSGGGTCTAAGSGNIADRINLPGGASATYTATCAVSATTANTSLSNTATVSLPGPVTDPVQANNTATDTNQLLRIPAHLFASKLVTGMFLPLTDVTYTIVVANDGAGKQFDNGGNELVDVLPPGLTLVSVVASSGTAVANLAANTVTWNGEVPAGGVVTLTVVATINATAGTSISNQASFVFDADGDASNEGTGSTDAFPCPPATPLR